MTNAQLMTKLQNADCYREIDNLLDALRAAERELNIAAQSQPQVSIALATVRAAIAKAESRS